MGLELFYGASSDIVLVLNLTCFDSDYFKACTETLRLNVDGQRDRDRLKLRS